MQARSCYIYKTLRTIDKPMTNRHIRVYK